MKKALFGLILLFGLALPAAAQQILIEDVVVSGGQSYLGKSHDIVNPPGLAGMPGLAGVRYFAMDFTPVGGGTLTTCGATVDSILAPADWVQGNAIASQNCATRGTASSASALSADHVRLSVGTTGNGMVRVRLFGCLAQCTAAAGSAVWGSITGILSGQTDLNTALGLKAPLASPTFTTSTSVASLFGSTLTKTFAACETAGAPTTLSGASTPTGLNCLPAGAVIDAVVYRITTTITTAVSFTIGDGSTAARFCGTQSVMTAGTTGVCFLQADQTGAAGPIQAAADAVVVTPDTTPGAGAIRLLVYYHTWAAPTS
ncbi:MAG: hypothetical protein ACRDQZ_25490 [Mycobacteriales bacterium]